jgi:hypothetical protein
LRLRLSNLRVSTESPTRDAEAVNPTNRDMASQSGSMEHALGPTPAGEHLGFGEFSSQTRRNGADDHGTANTPEPSPASDHSEPVSHEQTGNNLTTSGVDLETLDPAAAGRVGSLPQPEEDGNHQHPNPISLLPSANSEGMGFDLNPRVEQNGMENYDSANHSSPHSRSSTIRSHPTSPTAHCRDRSSPQPDKG